MNTYLVFFGKSQAFNLHAFNSHGTQLNFDSIIDEFDMLESKHVPIDDAENGDVLSKYTFIKGGKCYSMLKLYSHAQAMSTARVAGSIYGVAIVSEADLLLTESNISFLVRTKEAFKKHALDNLKFRKNDFGKEAKEVVDEMMIDGGLFATIDQKGKAEPVNNTQPVAYYIPGYIHTLEYEALRLPILSNKMYFSEDLLHLIRNYSLGEGELLLYEKSGDGYQPYSPGKTKNIDEGASPETHVANTTPVYNKTQSVSSHDLVVKTTELKNRLRFIEKKLKIYRQLFIGTLIILVLIFIFFVTKSPTATSSEHTDPVQDSSLLETASIDSISIANRFIAKKVSSLLSDSMQLRALDGTVAAILRTKGANRNRKPLDTLNAKKLLNQLQWH